jgi:anti-repressor protein
MATKNSEAPIATNNQGFGVSNLSRATNMQIIAKSDLNFHGTALIPVSNITGTWLTSSDLAKALQYANSRAVTMIYNKFADEFF